MSEYHKLKTEDRLLALSGVPVSVLKKQTPFSQLTFNPTSARSDNKVSVIDPVRQKALMQEILQRISYLGTPAVYVIGASPSEKPAFDLAANISRAYNSYVISQGKLADIKWYDIASPDWEYVKSGKKPDLVVIHGLSDNAHMMRIEHTRDITRNHDNATIFILISTSNCYEYAQKFGISLNGVFQLGRVTHKSL